MTDYSRLAAQSKQALDARWKAAREEYPPCLRCGHPACSHWHSRCKYDHRGDGCDCKAWVPNRCEVCGEFMGLYWCKTCKRNERAALMASIAERQERDRPRKEQLKWLRDGKKTLTEIRKLVRPVR